MRIYFDHAASSPLRKEVLEAFSSENSFNLYNPSSVHLEGQKTRAKINDVRDLISGFFGMQYRKYCFYIQWDRVV